MRQRGRGKLTGEEHDVLKAIYERRSHGRLDRFEQRKRSRGRFIFLFLSAFVGVAALLAVAGFVFFSQSEPFDSANVRLTLTGAETAASGDVFVLTARIENSGSVGLREANLTVRYPDTLTYASSSPKAADDFGNRFVLGDIGPNATVEVKIRGTIVGDIGSALTFSGDVRYEPQNFSSEFSATDSFATTIRNSPLIITIEGPTAAADGQDVTIAVSVKNAQDETLKRVRVEMQAPKEFQEVSFDPKPESGSWDFPELKPDAKQTITVRAKLSGAAGALTELKVRAGILGEEAAFVVQREASALLLILSPTLNVALSVDGADAGRAIEASEILKATLTVRNDSETVFKDIEARLQAVVVDSSGKTHDPLDVASVTTDPDATWDGRTITWQSKDVAAFQRMIPDVGATFTAELPLIGGLQSLGTGMNFSFILSATITGTVEETGTAYEKKTETISFPITTELRVSASGEFSEGENPPQVGQRSAYQLKFQLTNTFNGITDALLRARLPEGIEYVSGSATAGNTVTFESASREILWRLPTIEAQTGGAQPTVTATVTVAFIPTDAQVDTEPTLVEPAVVSGTDAYTKAKLSAEGQAVVAPTVIAVSPPS